MFDSLLKTNARFVPDVVIKLSLGEKGANNCFWWGFSKVANFNVPLL
jgi:hypothetical protein